MVGGDNFALLLGFFHHNRHIGHIGFTIGIYVFSIVSIVSIVVKKRVSILKNIFIFTAILKFYPKI
jgi:hypothetical protein